MSFIDVASMITKEFLKSVLTNSLFLPVYLILIYIIKIQYEKYLEYEIKAYGQSRKSIGEMIKESVFFAVVIGYLGNVIVVCAGVPINTEGFKYLLAITALLVCVNIRYASFANAGGILVIISLLFNLKLGNVSSLLLLVGVIHLVESILIFLNADRDSVPVFIMRREGIVGAFVTRKYWPVPLVLLSYTAISTSGENPYSIMPQWWPLFKPDFLSSGILAFGMECSIAVLGYSYICTTEQPDRRNKQTAFELFCYSIILVVISVISFKIYAFRIIGAIFCVAAYQGMIIYRHYSEKHGTPLYSPVKRGLRVLDVLSCSHAEKMGMQRGDIILSINGKDIQTERGMEEGLKSFPVYVWISVITAHGEEKNYEYKCYPDGLNSLGILTVPRENEVTYNVDTFENFGILKDLVSRFRMVGKWM